MKLLPQCVATFLGSVMISIAVLFAAPAEAIPGLPTCPGNGNDTVVLGADGGWCDYLFLPDGSHVSCRWADFTFLIDVGGHTECRRVDASEQLLPSSPPWQVFTNWGDNERAIPTPDTP